MKAAIQLRGLVKEYDGTRALEGADLEVPTGCVLGLLGSNGAGKTTIIRILATLIRPDGGHVEVAGYDVVEQAHNVRERIGLTGQYASVDENTSGWDNLLLVGRLCDLGSRRAKARADALLEEFRLSGHASELVGTYSGGLCRRLDLAASLVSQPEVLFMDEPTTGLDPLSRGQNWDTIRSLANQGTTVLLTTQYMEAADFLADRIVVMDHGRVLEQDAPQALRGLVGGLALRVRLGGDVDLAALARQLADPTRAAPVPDIEEGTISFPVSGPDDMTAAVQAIAAAGVPVERIETYAPGLDEVFLALTASSRVAGGGTA